MVRSQKNVHLHRLIRRGSGVAARHMAERIVAMPGVVAVYARHTHPRSSSFVLGQSDLDLTVALSDTADREPDKIAAVSGALERLGRCHFYIEPQDARFATATELRNTEIRYGARYEILYQPESWTLLAGTEVREARGAFPDWEITWHPEFNRFWQHILQNELFNPKTGREGDNLRALYRGALKQQLQFLAANHSGAPRLGESKEEDIVEVAFDAAPELRDALAHIQRAGFWLEDARSWRERVHLEVLRLSEAFFRSYDRHPKDVEQEGPPDSGSHADAYQALRSRLDSAPQLLAMLEAVLVFPVSHGHPYFYQIEILIPTDVTHETFRRTVRAIQQEFRRREFSLGKHGFSLAVSLSGTLRHPLSLLGSPFPFLREHIQRYGQCVWGERPDALRGSWGNEIRRAWCGTFLPFFLLNLKRRVEHSARTLNFCQLASVRLFLDTGQVETDAMVVRTRHQERFGDESPVDSVWDYLLRDKPGRQDRDLYGAATLALSRECDCVGALLDDLLPPTQSG